MAPERHFLLSRRRPDFGVGNAASIAIAPNAHEPG
jgi:hypothetical protein